MRVSVSAAALATMATTAGRCCRALQLVRSVPTGASAPSSACAFLRTPSYPRPHPRLPAAAFAAASSVRGRGLYVARGSGDAGGGSNDEEESGEGTRDFEPTWTYAPYEPPTLTSRGGAGRGRPPNGGGGGGGGARRFSTSANGGGEWRIPKKVTVPMDRVEISFVRSSGAGGQNVNKVNTKVELRFRLSDATWIPAEVRNRIRANEAGRINREGYLTVTSQEYRTQAQNRKDAISKLEAIVLRSYPRPKVRKMRKGISKKAKERKKEDKRRRSQIKASRKRVDF